MVVKFLFVCCLLPCVFGLSEVEGSEPNIKATAEQQDPDLMIGMHNLRGQPGMGYYMAMEIGSPPQTMNILIDTGSSNFAIACSSHPYLNNFFDSSASSTFISSDDAIEVPYSQGNWKGFLAKDVVSIPSLNITIKDATLACISSSENFFMNGSQWQGIVGLGYSDIAVPDSSIEPLFDAAVRHGLVNNSFSIQLCGSLNNDEDTNPGGTLAVNSHPSDGNNYVMIRKPWYYEVIITSITVDGMELQEDCKEYNYDKTIVDSGTTNLRLPERVFRSVIKEIQPILNDVMGQVIDPAVFDGSETGAICPDHEEAVFSALPVITIFLAASANSSLGLKFNPFMYLRPVKDSFLLHPTNTCYKLAITSSDTGAVIGAVIMEGYNVFFDRENQHIGFASTTCPNAEFVNPGKNLIATAYRAGLDAMDCAFNRPNPSSGTMLTAAYVMAGVCAACVIPIIVMVVYWQYVRWREDRERMNGSLLVD